MKISGDEAREGMTMNQNITVLGPANSPISLHIIQVDKDGQPLAVQDSTLQSVGDLPTIVTHGQVLDADATVVKAELVSGSDPDTTMLTEALPVQLQPTPAKPSQMTISSPQLAVTGDKTAMSCDDGTTGILVNNKKHNGNNVAAVEVDAVSAKKTYVCVCMRACACVLVCLCVSSNDDDNDNNEKRGVNAVT